MNPKASNNLTASKLRIVLVSTMILTIILGVAGFYFASTLLFKTAGDVAQKKQIADAKESDVKSLQTLETKLKNERESIERINKILADSSDNAYRYQDQAINDLNAYAQRAGVRITSYQFAAPAPVSSASTPQAALPAGVTTTNVSISLENPVPFHNLMNFVKSIEANLTKMQIASIELTRDPENQTAVTSNSLTIGIFTKQ